MVSEIDWEVLLMPNSFIGKGVTLGKFSNKGWII